MVWIAGQTGTRILLSRDEQVRQANVEAADGSNAAAIEVGAAVLSDIPDSGALEGKMARTARGQVGAMPLL